MRDAQVRPVDTAANDGMRVYQRSVLFTLVVALRELFPNVRVLVDHSVTMGGFFCQIEGRELFTASELATVEQRMREIVAADEPIEKGRVSTQEAVAHFAAQGYEDKVRLLGYRQEPDLPIYALRGVRDYFYGFMAPSTGCLRWFSLESYPPGFILRLPRRRRPADLPPRRDHPKLMRVFREYGRWLGILGIEDVGALNQKVRDGHMREAILISEALHEKRIVDIADEIMTRSGRVRLVLIAGPSSSGKTTFARRLAIQLYVHGLTPFALGLDDYFVPREMTPRDESGEYDFEALEAVNVPLFNQHLQQLMAGETVRLPHYDFQLGRSVEGQEASLTSDTVIIVEGIHGLNPELVTGIPTNALYRIYVSALTQLNIDHHNRVPTTDGRLLRRIVRDDRYRGYSATDTINRWESVRRGEERWIFPFQEYADVMFNSALAYEMSVLKPYAEPLLLRVPRGTEAAMEARRLLAFLRWVAPSEADLVPDNSLLREFIGGSILQDFRF
jgi:uridine kinase